MDSGKPNRIGSAEIAAIIRRDIAQGELAARERLMPERQMANQHSVSRGTVREALNQLADEGLVEIRHGSGTYVVDTQPVDAGAEVVEHTRPLELIDARFALEPHLCRLAVLQARPADLDAMDALLTTMENSIDDPQEFSAADKAFHSLLATSTGNSLLIWITSHIASVRNQEEWSRMRQVTLNAETISSYNLQHRKILNAIRAREPERAATMMKEHLEAARLSLTRSVET